MPSIPNSERKKIALIVQRYGKSINGGAEAHARMIAMRLSDFFDMTILTSRAIDHHTWKPELPEGETTEDGIRMIRFNHPAKGISLFARLQYECLKIFFGIRGNKKPKGRGYSRIEKRFDLLKLIKQGPYMPEMINYIEEQKDYYDAFIFFTYLYYPTVMGIQKVGNKSILIPTIHDEPAVYRPIYQPVMSAPAVIFFNTQAEKDFSEKLFDIRKSINRVVAVGVEVSTAEKNPSLTEKYGIRPPYIIFVGRIDKGKGAAALIKAHADFTKKHGDRIRLVMVGKSRLNQKQQKNAVFTGFLPEDEKNLLIAGASALVVPSRYESLSLALLEGFARSVPGIINGNSRVLADHILKGSAGWSYSSIKEFENILNRIIEFPEEALRLGKNGRKYVEENYRWDHIIATYNNALNTIFSVTK